MDYINNLRTRQQQFQSYILKDNLLILNNIISSKKLSAKQQLQIYQNSYYERIIAAMKQDFPILCESIGEAAFESLVCDYIKKFPSKNFNLRYVGKNLAEFILAQDESFAPYAELAEREWLLLTS
ncbi:MAG: DNA-binding domain-containing protein [Gammaproteobacteria bacterium]|nr:DNA-binding domain-containing protein [Gammaproteobacteria bacterium]